MSGMFKRQRGAPHPGGAKRARPASASQIVKRAVRASHELKNLDTVLNFSAGSGLVAGTNFLVLNAIAQGVNANDRTGRDAIMEGIQIKAQLYGTAINAYDAIRVQVFWDTECRGVQAAGADLYSNTGAGMYVSSQINFDNRHRFKVLSDRTYVVEAKTATTDGVRAFVQNFKIGKKTHFYNTSTPSIADIDSGAIYLVVTSQFGTTSITGDLRLLFRDV